jgi:hypothetical protein
MRRGAGGMRRCGVWNTAERRRTTTKNLERHHLGFLGLQHLEIPQNGQRNVWKSLDRNTLDLEKLAKKLGARLCFAAFAPARRGLEPEPAERGCGDALLDPYSLTRLRLAVRKGVEESVTVNRLNRRIAAIRSSMSPNDRNEIMGIERYLARRLKSDQNPGSWAVTRSRPIR